ncbi:hypothetical protein EMCRGX_G031545 [Ephydatia muelleri]
MAQFIGTVVGTKMQNTAKVSVIRMSLHPQVLKYVRQRKTYFAHDVGNQCREGDTVRIQEAAKSFSKRKHFVVAQILDKSGHPRTHLHVTESATSARTVNTHPKTQKDTQT